MKPFQVMFLHLSLCALRCANGTVKIPVKEDSDVVLPCSLSSKASLDFELFDWKKDRNKEVFLYDAGVTYDSGRQGQDEQFKGRVSHFVSELKNGNASIKITQTKVSDSGTYTCDFPRLQPRQTYNIQLVVGTCPGPTVKELESTRDESVLQCDVRGVSPKPVVEWRDTSGNILSAESQVTERGGIFDITLKTTVANTDFYRCVVSQAEICQVEEKINVFINGPPIGWIITTVILAVLLAVTLLILLLVVLGILNLEVGRVKGNRGSSAI